MLITKPDKDMRIRKTSAEQRHKNSLIKFLHTEFKNRLKSYSVAKLFSFYGYNGALTYDN